MIVKNERHRLPRLLRSIQNCFDQIVIVDTGSTDGTVAFLKSKSSASLPIEVYHFKWIDDFSAARNYSVSLLNTDFVVWLDADDELIDSRSFRHFKNFEMNRKDVWFMPYEYLRDSQNASRFTHSVERVFRRSLNAKFQGWVHETIPLRSKWRVANVKDVSVRHHRAAQSERSHLLRNLRILNIQKTKSPRSFGGRLRFQLGLELFELGKLDEAEAALRGAWRSPQIDRDARLFLLQKLVFIDLLRAQKSTLGRSQIRRRIIQNCRRAIHLDPGAAEFFCWHAEIELICERQNAALAAYTGAIKCRLKSSKQRNLKQAGLSRYYNEWPWLQRARIFIDLDQYEAAFREMGKMPKAFYGPEYYRLLKIVRDELSRR